MNRDTFQDRDTFEDRDAFQDHDAFEDRDTFQDHDALQERDTLQTRDDFPNRGTFQWNAGGWFGAQLGSTCWMLIAGVVLLWRSPGAAVATLIVFAATNAAGTALWTQRRRLRPLRAMQALVAIAGLASALATYVIDSAGQFESLGAGGSTSARSMYLLLAGMVVSLLLLFYLIDREGKSSDAGATSRRH
ncbi:MAG TPA: hypothetical protein VGC93_09115 [Thermoanaerobaculia bacterium]